MTTVQLGNTVYEKQPDGSLVPIGEASPDGQVSARTMADILADPPDRVPRLLEPALIVEQGITVLAAPTKVGKTNLWFHAAKALTQGDGLWGRFTAPRPVPVLMIQLELSESTLYERLRFLREELDWSEEAQQRFFVRCERSVQLDRRGGPERLGKIIESCPERPEVVILDSYNAAVVGDPDKSAEARRALHALRQVQERTGVAWGITAEIRKAPAGGRLRYSVDDLKGSNDLAYDADAVVMLRPTDQTRRRLGVHFLAMRHAAEEPPEGLVLVRRGLTFDLTEGPSDEVEEQVAEVIRAVIRSGVEPTTRACRDAVREAGIRIRYQAVVDVRRRILEETR